MQVMTMTLRWLLQAVLGVALVSACGPSVIVVPRQPMVVQVAPPLADEQAQDPRAGEPGAGPYADGEAADEYANVAEAPSDAEARDDEDSDPAALQRFRNDLDQHGQWIEDARYGTVWVPYSSAVGVNFRPYVSGGRWSTTVGDEWLWVSDYPFGNVVFHYGRWVWIPGQGWAWVAGNRYAPSWVHFWVADGGYIGWAPLAPVHIWRAGAVVWIVAPAPRATVFVPRRHVYSRRVSDHVVSNTTRARHLHQSARLQSRMPTYEQVTPPARGGATEREHRVATTASSVPKQVNNGETRRKAPYRTFSSDPGRRIGPQSRTTFAGPKIKNKVASKQRPAASVKQAKSAPQRMDKRSKRNDVVKPQRRAADSVVVSPKVKPPARRPARSDAPPRAHKSGKERKAQPPMPRVRKIPQEMKLPPRRIAPPPRGRHITPAARRRH
jgi:hypothetical protein